jgi:hypothetical protein
VFASIDNGVIDLDNDDGIDETPSEASGLGSRLHFSLIFIDLEHEDGMDQTLSEPPRLGSRASASTNDGFIELGYDRGIDVLLINNEPPGLGSCLSALLVDNGVTDVNDDNGIDVPLVNGDSLLAWPLVCLLRLSLTSTTQLESMRLQACLLDLAASLMIQFVTSLWIHLMRRISLLTSPC